MESGRWVPNDRDERLALVIGKIKERPRKISDLEELTGIPRSTLYEYASSLVKMRVVKWEGEFLASIDYVEGLPELMKNFLGKVDPTGSVYLIDPTTGNTDPQQLLRIIGARLGLPPEDDELKSSFYRMYRERLLELTPRAKEELAHGQVFANILLDSSGRNVNREIKPNSQNEA
jgi:hypothetical protein